MRVGLQVPNFTWPQGQAQLGDMFALVAERAERAGFYSFWVMDHFFQIPTVGPAENEMLEGWSALAFAAGHTNYMHLGTMVTGVTYRHPGILVKTATTLDVLSHGRAYLGIGAAWNEQEHQGLGVPFPPLKERFERLVELQERVSQERNEALVGRTLEVLVEGRGRKGRVQGRTRTNKLVHFDGQDEPGRFVDVGVTAAHPHHLDGVLVPAAVPA